MTPAQRAALRALAKAATPGPLTLIRYYHGGGRMYLSRVPAGLTSEDRELVADLYQEGNREFYFACSPEVIEGLLDDLDAAERLCAGQQDRATWGDMAYADHERMRERIATLEAREKRLREAIEQAVKRINGAALHQMHEAAEDEVREALLYLGAALAEPDAQGTPRG